MLQGAQLAHLESLLGAAVQSTSPAPQYSTIAPVLQVPAHLPQVSMPCDSTHYFPSTATPEHSMTYWLTADATDKSSPLMV